MKKYLRLLFILFAVSIMAACSLHGTAADSSTYNVLFTGQNAQWQAVCTMKGTV